MSAHDSQFPEEEEGKTRHVRADGTGASMSWNGWIRLAAAILALLGGTGGYVGFQFVTSAELEASEQKQEARVVEVETKVTKEVSGIKSKIGTLSGKVDKVQKYQISQDARQEARRITEDIRNRDNREEQYDRLRELNEKRLKKGKDPCTTLDCTN